MAPRGWTPRLLPATLGHPHRCCRKILETSPSWANCPSVFAGVSPGQRASEGSVLEAGHLIRAAGEDLDMLRAHSHPLHGSDEGPAPRSAAAVQRLHHVQSEKTDEVPSCLVSSGCSADSKASLGLSTWKITFEPRQPSKASLNEECSTVT